VTIRFGGTLHAVSDAAIDTSGHGVVAHDRDHARLVALHRLDILDTEPEQAFNDIVRLAAELCDTPIAAVTLVDSTRQWFKARVGIDVDQLPRTGAFCDRTLHHDRLMVVEDSLTDPSWCDNPYVVADPHVRFYAGAPLRTDDGVAVGSLCVIDRVPRRLTPTQLGMLEALGRQVERLFSYRIALKESERAKEDLAQSENRLQLILDSISQGVAVHSPDGGIVQANPAAARILGLTEDQLLGRTPVDPRWRAIHRDGRPFPGEDHPSSITLRHGVTVRDVTLGILRPDDERRWLIVNSSPISFPGVDGSGAVVTFTDVTDMLALNDQLQGSLMDLVTASTERASMLSAVSHDLRAPLAAIRMMTEILEDRGDAITEEQERELVHRIRVEARRTEGALADLVAANRIGGGLNAPRRQRVDLEHLIRNNVREFANDSHHVRLGEMRGDLMLWADRAQVERILDNLISNALRHTPAGSTVLVGAIEHDDVIDLVVEDNGSGVADDMKARIFDAYVRGEQADDRPGTGIGLFLVARFAQFHHGRATCEDSPLGGARFVVTFPGGPVEPPGQ